MTISIALAIYNGSKFLEKQLESLVSQTIQPSEIVIVDDFSTDDSDQIIQNFDFGDILVRYYKNERNLGVNKTFKKLILLCTGDYIATCDQDDIWLPNKLELSLRAMQEMEQSVPCIVYTDLKIIDQNDNLLKPSLYADWGIDPAKYPFRLVLFDNVIIGCTAFFNKQMQSSVKLMPHNVKMHDYWMALIGYSFGSYRYVNEPAILYRSHQNSVTPKLKKSKLDNLINEIQSSKQYLKQNVDQAKEFLKIYEKELSVDDMKILKQFIRLENRTFLFKRIYAKMLKSYINQRFCF